MKQKITLKFSKDKFLHKVKAVIEINKYDDYQAAIINYIQKRLRKGIKISKIYVPYILEYAFTHKRMFDFLEETNIELIIIEKSTLKIVIDCSGSEDIKEDLL